MPALGDGVGAAWRVSVGSPVGDAVGSGVGVSGLWDGEGVGVGVLVDWAWSAWARGRSGSLRPRWLTEVPVWSPPLV